MFSRLTLFLALLSPLVSSVTAKPCVAFDANFVLYAFGLNGKDFNAGTQDTWATSKPQDITTNGRPPFDASVAPSCYLSRFQNSIYVLNGDSKNPNSVYIYDATAKSWSMQQSNPTGQLDLKSAQSILDHDTNIFYTLSKGELYFLDLKAQTAAVKDTLPWVDAKKAAFDTTNYNPVMALANNHIHFLNVPGVAAGSADIFVIHFSWFQPDSQAYPVNGGGTLPAAHGQVASFYQKEGVQQEFAYIPDDGSATYVVNVMTNTTQKLTGPATKDPASLYAASITALVQVDSKGIVSYLPYKQGDEATNKAAAWTVHQNLASVIPPPPSPATSGISTAKSQPTANPQKQDNVRSKSKNGASFTSSVPTMFTLLFSFIGLFLAV